MLDYFCVLTAENGLIVFFLENRGGVCDLEFLRLVCVTELGCVLLFCGRADLFGRGWGPMAVQFPHLMFSGSNVSRPDRPKTRFVFAA